jgi:hypothetical protein
LFLFGLLSLLWWVVKDSGVLNAVRTFSNVILTSATVLYMTDPSEAIFMNKVFSGVRPLTNCCISTSS